MNFKKLIIQVLTLIVMIAALASCSDEGCVEADEFDVESATVKANPQSTDGVHGTYPTQNADWHSTGLRANGQPFVITVAGAWTSWLGDEGITDQVMNSLPVCNFCAKKVTMPSVTINGAQYDSNCICYSGKSPEVEDGPDGKPMRDYNAPAVNGVAPVVDCSVLENQNNPSKCTCTKDHQYGSALDYGVYHFPRDIFDKNEQLKIADKQSNCKYNAGMGLYIALFGNNGTITPTRAYHMFSTKEICNIRRNSENKCLDIGGNDMTKYLFVSANNQIFMKNDFNGNDGTDTDPSNDVYHTRNEYVKVVINDQYYFDNHGGYDLVFLRGVGTDREKGLLEFLVSMVEDTFLGNVDEDGVRHNGFVEFMYKSIVKDKIFIRVLQLTLSMYVAFYGIAVLLGVVEVNKKELLTRVVKLSLVIFFTSETSWYFYNQIVVGFFKDSMDSVVAMVMNLSNQTVDASTQVVLQQIDNTNNVSNSTRFSYIDYTIKNMLSKATAKKIFSLFFANILGMIYIPMIYALIFGFIYVMLMAALVYLINVLKIIFALALGPIFITFSLFSQTNQMFKNWISFLGARSLEIILMFMLLYNFVVLINDSFGSLLSYRACPDLYDFGLFSIKIMMAQISDRSAAGWFTAIVTLAGLIFIMKLVLDKVPEISGFLISIGGVANRSPVTFASFGQGSFNMATQAFRDIGGLFKDAASKGSALSGMAVRAAVNGVRDKIGSGLDAIGNKLPVRGMGARTIDAAIEKGQAEARSKGMSGVAADSHARKVAMDALRKEMQANPNKMAAYGVNADSISRRFERQLVEKQLEQFLKEKSKELRSAQGSPLDIRQQLKDAATQWGKDNLNSSESKIADYLKKMDGKVDKLSKRDTYEAAKAFADNKKMQGEYLQSLRDKREQKQAASGSKGSALKERNFTRRTQQLEGDKPWYQRSRLAGKDDVLAARKANLFEVAQSSNATPEQRQFARKEFERLGTKDLDKAFLKAKTDPTARRKIQDELNKEKDIQRLIAIQSRLISEGFKSADDNKLKDPFVEMEEKRQKALDKKMENVENDLKSGKISAADAKAAVDNIKENAAQGFVAHGMEVKFGASINDIGLKAVDIGLQGSNVLLGTPDANAKDPAKVSALSNSQVNKIQAQTKLKIATFEKKMKEFELKVLQADLNHDQSKASQLQLELSKIEADVASFERGLNSAEAAADAAAKAALS